MDKLILIFAGAFGTVILQYLGVFQLNKKASYISIVTKERCEWLDNLSTNLSKYCGLVHTLSREGISIPDKDRIRMLEETDRLYYLIQLLLNPKMHTSSFKSDEELVDLIQEIHALIDNSKFEDLELKIENVTLITQNLLKQQWEKIKAESKTGDLKDKTNNFLKKIKHSQLKKKASDLYFRIFKS